MNETLQTINNRRSVRMFFDKPVSEADLQVILQAANQAPSAHNQQSWRFVVLRGEKKKQLVEMISAKAADFPRPSSALLRMASRSIASAPVVIAVANSGELIKHEVLEFIGEPDGEFMAVIPVGYASRPSGGPQKQPLAVVVKHLD